MQPLILLLLSVAPSFMACPSTIVNDSSFIPRPPLVTVAGASVATPSDCISLCCDHDNCTEWIHTTDFEPHATGTTVVDQRPGGCVIGEPCCQLHSCPNDKAKGCHHNIHPHNQSITSGRTTQYKLQFAGVFSNNMVLQREPSSASIYGIAVPKTAVQVRLIEGVAPVSTVATHSSPLDGSWQVLLPAMPAGGNYSIQISSPKSPRSPVQVEITNITFGDVWICSGRNLGLPLCYDLLASLLTR